MRLEINAAAKPVGPTARISRLVTLAIMPLLISTIQAQQDQKRALTFHGRVEQVNPSTKRLAVHSEPIEGWMGEMTMGFAVDNNDVFNRVKAGDQITAIVYEGDFTLHDVQVVPPGNVKAPGMADQGGMRLEDMEQMALANNPTVAQARANLRAAAGLVRQAGFYPNPTVGYYGDEIRGGVLGGGKQGGFVSQTIVMGGKLRAARRVAELEAAEVETSGQIQQLRIQNSVRTLFYQLLAAQRLVAVKQNLATLAADVTMTSRQLGNVGQADLPDILQAEVEQQQANLSVRIAQQDLQTEWRVLATVAGKPDLAPVHLAGDLDALPDLNYEEWVATTMRESLQVKLAQQGVEHAEAFLVQAKKAPIPDLQLTGTLVQSYEPLDTTQKPTGVQGGAQIGVQLPIFNRNQGNIAAAKGQIESAKQEVNRVKLQLQRNLASLFSDYDSARLVVQQYKAEMLPRAEQAYRLYQTSYQQMAGAYPQVLISQRTLFQLEAEYVQALANAWAAAQAIRSFGLMDELSEPLEPANLGGPSRSVRSYPSGASVH